MVVELTAKQSAQKSKLIVRHAIKKIGPEDHALQNPRLSHCHKNSNPNINLKLFFPGPVLLVRKKGLNGVA
jgi:hypothetical protein